MTNPVAANAPPSLFSVSCHLGRLTIYFVHGPGGLPMSNVYCTDPADAYDALSVRPSHFDVLRLPDHCLAHLDVGATYDGDSDEALEAFKRERRGKHTEAILRAVYSGVPLGARAEREKAEAMAQIHHLNRNLRKGGV